MVHLVGCFHSCITMHGFININFTVCPCWQSQKNLLPPRLPYKNVNVTKCKVIISVIILYGSQKLPPPS